MPDNEFRSDEPDSVTARVAEDGPVIMRKGRPYFKTTIEIDRNNLERFREFFPQSGALKEFVNRCLDKFVAIHEPTTDRDTEEAVQSAIEDMNEGEE